MIFSDTTSMIMNYSGLKRRNVEDDLGRCLRLGPLSSPRPPELAHIEDLQECTSDATERA
jgi:hypothetical protein